MDTKKFIDRQTKILNKEIDEAANDFKEPSDISVTATDALAHGKMGYRKGNRKSRVKKSKK